MFGENQRRYFISQFRYIDELLGAALEELNPEADPNRLFQKIDHDATLAQRKTLGDFVSQLRFSLRRFMQANDLYDERGLPSGLWAFRTAVSFARIAAQELRPNYWSGYGAVEPAAAAAGERFAAELVSILGRIDGYLLRGEGVELKDRLAQLEGLSEEASLLAELERLIATHGLIELRAPLELLIDRARNPRFEVAVFGRVNSGKSSLLNWWLGQEILPTGVTPVTSVPTHIAHGETQRVRLTVAGSSEVSEIPLGELPRYVTEQSNARNFKQLLKIAIEVPAERLDPGIHLVDTPGLGSLATAGAAQTLEYLPRCDLGILLIEAGSPISREEIDVARALIDAGSDIEVVLSKADQLSTEDLESARSYVDAQFARELQIPVIAHPVSTLPRHVALATAWFGQEIALRLARHRGNARIALRRKIAVLREAVAAAIDSRLTSTPRAPVGGSQGATSDHDLIAQARLEIERAGSTLRGLRIAHSDFGSQVTEALQRELARGWFARDATDRLRERVELAARRAGSGPGDTAALALHRVHDRLSDVLRHTEQNSPEGLPSPRGRPMLELPTFSTRLYRWPRWLPPLAGIGRLVARMHVSRSIIAEVQQQMVVYAEALSRWGLEHLEELTTQFNAAIAPVEAESRSTGTLADPILVRSARQDLERLRRWPRTCSPR
jgi:GTP-binding protein EngB required for normal cell division